MSFAKQFPVAFPLHLHCYLECFSLGVRVIWPGVSLPLIVGKSPNAQLRKGTLCSELMQSISEGISLHRSLCDSGMLVPVPGQHHPIVPGPPQTKIPKSCSIPQGKCCFNEDVPQKRKLKPLWNQFRSSHFLAQVSSVWQWVPCNHVLYHSDLAWGFSSWKK